MEPKTASKKSSSRFSKEKRDIECKSRHQEVYRQTIENETVMSLEVAQYNQKYPKP